ncbi:hypothetical protein [Agarilytica rhodophyticola]|uniref:hypothetical protein n=1 Tax=Agarilytica rhodophyticola TaxID=1737490 RepID=UPI000B3425F6|nr:hypothetical protein [Agarilytica rhodophyticola]
MQDRSWMLNPKAIRQAKQCINLIKSLTGKRVKLSDPDFIQVLHEHVEKTGSRNLRDAYTRLIAMAGVGFVVQSLRPQHESFNMTAKKA